MNYHVGFGQFQYLVDLRGIGDVQRMILISLNKRQAVVAPRRGNELDTGLLNEKFDEFLAQQAIGTGKENA